MHKPERMVANFFPASLPKVKPLSCQQREERKNNTFSSVFPLKEGVNSLGYIVWYWFSMSSGVRKSIWLSMLHILNYILLINVLFTSNSKSLVSLGKLLSYQIKRGFSPFISFFSPLPAVCYILLPKHYRKKLKSC